MGIRQPSKTRAFLAQATAGAQKQQQAREELKKPALGGSAQAGTAMVTAGTQNQQSATQQVVSAGQQAAKDLTIKPENVGTSTTTAVSGAPTTAIPTLTSTAGRAIDTGESGNVSTVQTSIDRVNEGITSVTQQITDLDNRLQTAEGEDRAKLLAEKERLQKELQRYQDMITKENLGQIAGPSTFETEMMKTQRLLAGEGDDVGKLAALFGGRKRKFGALESQIYGKDLEMLQEAAGEALTERGLAEEAADVAGEEYQSTLEKSKKAYETGLDKETEKLDVLTKPPAELVKYDRAKLIELFGSEKIVNELFNFDGEGPNAKVINNKASSTRKVLTDRQEALRAESLKGAGALEKAKEVKATKDQFDKDVQDEPNLIKGYTASTNNSYATASRIYDKINQIKRDAFAREWSGISKDQAIAENMRVEAQRTAAKQKEYIDLLEKAKNSKNIADYNKYRKEYIDYMDERKRVMDGFVNRLTKNAREIMIGAK